MSIRELDLPWLYIVWISRVLLSTFFYSPPVMMQATLKLSDDALMSDFYPECYHVVYKVYIATVMISHNYFRQSGIQHWRHYKQAYVAFP